MKLRRVLCALIAVSLAGMLTSGVIAGDKEKELEARAKVSREAAQKTALEKVPGGQIKEGELEEEDGKLIWSFDITTNGSKDIKEIQVDAITGKVLSEKTETAKEEDEEASKEGKKEKDDDDKDEKK